MFKKTQLCTAVMAVFAGSVYAQEAQTPPDQAPAAQTQRVEITGSRIKRAETDGALPITVITRAELQASGATSIAEVVRNSTFSSTGNFRPQSGSSAQSFASVDLRGLGSSRTLVLIDGRRLPKAPNVGDSVDMNSIPMAAVERIEILTDGASAVYGSDAIGGVVNIITRKDFNGMEVSLGATRPGNDGGDRDEASVIMGVAGDKGRMIAGVGYSSRDIVYTRERPWRYITGSSVFGNNYASSAGLNPIGDCDFGEGFYTNANNGLCVYDFNRVAADEAQVSNAAVFARGEYEFAEDWSAYMNASVSHQKSFGRYAPVPGIVTVAADSPNNPTLNNPLFPDGPEEVAVYHRFAAAGNRDTYTDNNVYNLLVGSRGRVAETDIDFGYNYTESKYIETGRGYIVRTLAEQAINNGTYLLSDPYATPEEVLNGIRFNTGRDSLWRQNELYLTASHELFSMGGGNAVGLVGAEYRTEHYADLYDPLSSAGEVLGSAGNSSEGKRKVASVLGELSMPISKELEATLAARYEKYNDYGSDFSPKLALRYSPIRELSLRGSVGQGFRAPSLPVLHSKTSYSAESVIDEQTCMFFGSGDPAECRTIEDVQVDTYVTANPNLKSEKSQQFSFGATFDPIEWVSLKADYWNIKIKDAISYISAQDVVDRELGFDPRPIPTGLSITRHPVEGYITEVVTGYRNDGELKVSGIDINARTNFNFGEYGKLNNDLTISRLLTWRSSGEDVLGDAGTPKMRVALNNTWSYGDFSVGWNVNYIGSNGSERDIYDPVSGDFVVTVNDRVGAYVTHDIQANWDTPIKGGKLTVGILNAGDKLPTLMSYQGRAFNFNLYDGYGRQPYVRYTQKF